MLCPESCDSLGLRLVEQAGSLEPGRETFSEQGTLDGNELAIEHAKRPLRVIAHDAQMSGCALRMQCEQTVGHRCGQRGGLKN